MKDWVKKVAPAVMQRTLPLWLRMRLVVWTGRRGFRWHFPLPTDLLRELADSEPNAFHRFLWSNHLAYAAGYELSRFGSEKLEPSRRMLLDDMQQYLRTQGVAPECEVNSVFDAGCSLGHVLRFAETEVFCSATRLRGVDVDRYAVEAGSAYLKEAGSRIELITGDVGQIERYMAGEKLDVVLCCGVLMYFDQAMAARVVKALLTRTKVIAGFICLAHPEKDNGTLASSAIRPLDCGFIHNIDAMVQCAGGRVVSRRWIPRPLVAETSPPYMILAKPQ
ncbi:MAG: class I SAM-dependent methyltransferase [Acidobacteria bacterium]|nr:class I SAM-dependent methyltransferase [Acidobacteriota bacterium]